MEKGLVEVISTDTRWQEDVRWMISGQWDIDSVIEEETNWLKAQVLGGVVTLSELRAGVKWANALDQEACDMYGADLTQGAQVAERLARRIVHHAGRGALGSLRSKRHRTNQYAKNGQMPGMGRFETHDIIDRNLVQ